MFIPIRQHSGDATPAYDSILFHQLVVSARQLQVETIPLLGSTDDPIFPFYPATLSFSDSETLPTPTTSTSSTLTSISTSEIQITSSLSSSTPSLAHDSATTSSTTSAPSIITATVFTYPAEQTSTSTRAPLSTGAAAGIAIAATILLITALLMAFLFWARQRLHLGLTKPEPSSHRGRHTVDSIISDRHGSSSSSPVLPPCAMRTSPYTVRQASRGGSYKPDLDSSEDAPLQPWLLSDRIEPSCPPLAHTYSKHGHSPTPSSSCSSSSNQAPREKLPESYYSGIPPISVSVVERLLHSLAQHMDHQEPPTQLQVAAAAEGHRASEFDLVAIDEPPPQYPYGRS